MIFLSASIPDAKRDPKYFNTADIVAIRDAVRALATVVIPRTQLIWGGHPAITPLIRHVMQTMKSDVNEHVTLYQSEYFRLHFPQENKYIEKIIFTDARPTLEESLLIMRQEMLQKEHEFKVGIFIGGMGGVEKEFRLFRELHPTAHILPVASTGAAARIIYDNFEQKPNRRLLTDYAYMALFKELLNEYLQ
ncbi:hypothetical protein A3860_23730 [Niastella vici]|uniref:Uncharacterized protein n=1 Tax=Niastella vici TaxID=1703345 RepID=A0A1V9FYD5_9BACT|nr:hypothetical protein [Niastella vici]OQP63363.1 hypothetical protein A3860_23730 [Niastella vici]